MAMKKLRITVEGRAFDVTVEELSDDGVVVPELASFATPSASQPTPVAAPKAVTAPAPKPASGGGKDVVSQVSGMVVSVDVAVGDAVTEGQQLITIEAMKMNTYVMAPFAGKVAEILAAKGKSVLAGDVLLRLS